jgi:hypothetical protein
MTQEASIEYGVRIYGGHITPTPSKHVAVNEVERLIAAGVKNVWVVKRTVTDWEMA